MNSTLYRGGHVYSAASPGAHAILVTDNTIAWLGREEDAPVADAVSTALGGPAAVTVVCVDVPGCEHGAILATAAGGTVIFFSMATSFAAAALGAEGLAADVTMLVGNGYVPGHADCALELIRANPAVRELFEARLGERGSGGRFSAAFRRTADGNLPPAPQPDV